MNTLHWFKAELFSEESQYCTDAIEAVDYEAAVKIWEEMGYVVLCVTDEDGNQIS